MITKVTDENIDACLASPRPVLIKFMTKTCGPCKAVASSIADLAREYDGEIDLLEVDVEEASALGDRYEIRGVPTVVMVRSGEECDRIVGAESRSRYAALIERTLEQD